MKHLFSTSLVVTVAIVAALTAPSRTVRAATVLFQTTFNCPNWDQSMGLSASQVNCPGMKGWGSWTTGAGSRDQIAAAANNPGGLGGSGFRHWRGDGVNNNGGGIVFDLPAKATEFWIRYYARYQLGFAWSNPGNPVYTKDIYIHNNPAAGTSVLGFNGGASGWGIASVNPGVNYRSTPGWPTVMGGNTGDGIFHCYEAHFKLDTTGSNGIAQAWVDGVQNHNNTTANWGSASGNVGWATFQLGDNQSSPSNGVDMFTDFDDVVVDGSARVGCISNVPGAPTGFQMTR
ncbi:MAG: hypothetical protein A3H95_08365 [Acidobacteria bacterium RIFCSPLOWO2_02_FULL_64_15]|nr:MAG: hypothetical protein A3H95_08365 [Acidobacteria bacterium RIFCSPLOWO2_02_FULL_64_15]